MHGMEYKRYRPFVALGWLRLKRWLPALLCLLLLSGSAHTLCAQERVPEVERDSLEVIRLLPLPPKEIGSLAKPVLPEVEPKREQSAPFTRPLDPTKRTVQQLLDIKYGDIFKPQFITDRLSLKGKSIDGVEPQWNGLPLFEKKKELMLQYELNPRVTLSGTAMLGYSALPMHLEAYKQFNVGVGVDVDVTDKVNVGGKLHVGRFMKENYVNPELSMRLQLNSQWLMNMYGGVYQLQSPMMMGVNYRAMYGGMRVEFSPHKDWFLYGQASISRNNALYMGWAHNPYVAGFAGFGGGLGYRMPTGGSIGLGVDFHYNPMTQSYQPYYQIDPSGLIIFVFKKIRELVEEVID